MVGVLVVINKFLLSLSLVLSSLVLGQEKAIVLATDPWEPHYGPDLPEGGYLTEICKQAFEKSGFKVEVRFVPWKRAFEWAKNGKYGGILGGFYKKEREEFFLYSSPISRSIMALYIKKGSFIPTKYKTLEDLKGYLIGVVRGYHYSDEFSAATYLTKREDVHSEKNLNLLFLGRIQIIAGDRLVLKSLTNKFYQKYKGQLIELSPPLKENPLHIMISRKIDNADEVKIAFENGLAQLKKSGEIAEIMKKHGFGESDSTISLE